MPSYITYDSNGAVTGAYIQDLHPAHTSSHIEATPEQMANWVGLCVVGGQLVLKPPEPVDIEKQTAALQAAIITAIKAERDRRKFNGVRVGTKWLHTDTYSRTQWLGMVMMGASIPAIDWTTMDGTSVTTSQALAGQVFQGTALLDATLFGYAKALITQVEAAADPASVDVVTGWPATFGDA